ncbi:MAG: type IA DNA topoisomerase [Lachnospiraceae bacterium]|nr:type IA DNA topoisomerase [Lachnospiraceae bacterium]
MKNLYIAEKPSVAREFANALKLQGGSHDGYIEAEDAIVTWCVGHLVSMSYPDAYDESLARWSMDTIPFIPDTYKYQVIDSVKKQFKIVKGLLNRKDVSCIYVCTDSGREGEYIYRLVDAMAGVGASKEKRRVWIDSQTEEEILRGIREAKPLSAYDNLSAAAYLRAKEDYLMGINFSRVLTLKYGYQVKNFLNQDKAVISVGRVMTCVLGMIVRREREIRGFTKTPFYRVVGTASLKAPAGTQDAHTDSKGLCFEAEWRAVSGSSYFESPLLYKENGFKEMKDAEALLSFLKEEDKEPPYPATLEKKEKKTEKKNPPLLYNLAELQNDCARLFKISPDETLRVVQELYEKKLVTYPRTDARVLSTAVAKEIYKNIGGLARYDKVASFAQNIMNQQAYKGLAKSRYVNDKQITDHYAIIPTGQGLTALSSLPRLSQNVYEAVARRFISIFYPAAEYEKYALTLNRRNERLFANFKALSKEGYLSVMQYSFFGKKDAATAQEDDNSTGVDRVLLAAVGALRKGQLLDMSGFEIKEGETSPPKRYNSGSLILAMENAGQLIEDEELRAQIKGSGIGTSATRAEIIKKLVNNKYLALNKKTQVITPTQLGEMIHDVVYCSIGALLVPNLTASWEKGLTMVANGEVTEEDYMKKLSSFVADKTNDVKNSNRQSVLQQQFVHIAGFYADKRTKGRNKA